MTGTAHPENGGCAEHVSNADCIVVLDGGRIAEQGTHSQIVERRGLYYNLVRNQLELGSA